MNIKILGSGQEVGKSAVLLNYGKKVMLDFGVKIDPAPPTYPPFEKVDAVVLSHSHLDHSGAIPMLFKKGNPKLFMTDLTLELAAMLLKDSMKVAKKEGYNTPYSKKDFSRMVRTAKVKNYREKFTVGNASFSLWRSGHIPGSASTLVNAGKKVYYTSDIQTIDSQLLRKCELPPKADILIIESTYGDKNHPDRKQLEQQLIDSVEEAVANEETALIPVFAVGRAQEVMLVLEKYASMIALDGMSKLASEIISDYSYYLKDGKRFRSVLKKVNFIRPKERAGVIDKYPVIVATAGMLGGGPAVSYLRGISQRHNCKVLFTGFLGDETPGRMLMDTNIFKNTEEEFGVSCEVRQFGLSAHTDKRGIFEIIEHLKPEKVICVHGDSCEKLARSIEERFGCQAFAPKNGEDIKV